ncbi:MAG TPA: heme-binding protein [Anaeromyxobacteraceae bacterium]|nr:heme-binding protein [Anaeromyxobacteraceae bacterium]
MRASISLLRLSVAVAAVAAPLLALSQPLPHPYGAPVGVETARKAASGALAEARKNGWTVAAAVVDTGGVLVYFERIDGTQNGSSEVAIDKARSAAAFKRPTKAFEDLVAGGKTNYLRLTGAVPIEGGIPLVVEGRVIGAIGVSGATSAQDGACARAGADAAGASAPEKK